MTNLGAQNSDVFEKFTQIDILKINQHCSGIQMYLNIYLRVFFYCKKWNFLGWAKFCGIRNLAIITKISHMEITTWCWYEFVLVKIAKIAFTCNIWMA